ncbi:MAG TPA: cation:proton antiporter [Candidatus Bathyarchaeia archaeon]|nr:cation:proton antiporter [Candidatus Bathyarchaeia archaeon]
MAGETEFLLDLGVLTAAALIFSLVFVRLKLPVVSAQILAGMLVGPYVLGWVVNPTIINQISSIGIVLLLFIIGLELDPVELQKVATKIVSLTLVEVGLAFAFGLVASYLLGLGLILSIIFAMAASISSTAIVGKIILERRMFQASESKTLVGLMIMEDIIAIGFLITLSTIAPGVAVSPSEQLSRVIITGLGGVGLVAVGYLVAKFLAPFVIDHLASYEIEGEEIPFLFALALGLLFGILAADLGYSPGIGAFIIGLSIRGKQSKFLFEKVATLKDLFIVLFFVSMGSLINPFPALALGLPIVLVLILLVVGKFTGGYTIGTLIGRGREGNPTSPVTYGTWLIPRGEFSLVIGQFALSLGLVGSDLFSLIGLSVLVTAIVGPFLQRFTGPRLAPVDHALRPQMD